MFRNSGEPNNANNEDCAHWRTNVVWNDITCSQPMPFMCGFVDECHSTPCQNGGICRSMPSGATCECPSGFGGSSCQRACNPDTDSDGDLLDDCEDLCPFDATRRVDVDSDADGTVDCMDMCPHVADKVNDVDSDGDGILDCNECVPSVDDPTHCFVFHQTPRSWDDAQAVCKDIGGSLATVTSTAVNDQLWSMGFSNPAMIQAADFWIGLRKDSKGLWRWAKDDSPVFAPGAFTSWLSGEPNSDGDCGAPTVLNANYPGFWNNFWCDSAHPYFCEIENPDMVAPCPDGWRPWKGRCVQYNDARVSWYAADTFCKESGAELLSDFDGDLDTLAFIASVSTSYQTSRGTWVGATDFLTEGTFRWVTTNTSITAVGTGWWSPGEPNNQHGSEHCLEVYDTAQVNDNSCSKRNPFICEFPNGCLSSPCQNGGQCRTTPNETYCECANGFSGRYCDTPCLDTVDSDGDGVVDCADACPHDPSRSGSPDSDGDGTLDCNDLCPFDESKITDVDTDGDGTLDCNTCPPGWTLRDNPHSNTCIKRIPARLAFDEAKRNCAGMGSHLARITHPSLDGRALDPDSSLGTIWHGVEVWGGRWVQPTGDPLSHQQRVTLSSTVNLVTPANCVVLLEGFLGVQEVTCSSEAASVCELDLDEPCEEGWTRMRNKCVRVFGEPMRFVDAEQTCRRLGAEVVHLDDVDDVVKISYVLSNRGDDYGIWVGATDSRVEGEWMWGDGSVATSESLPWSPGQPDNAGNNEDCAHIRNPKELNDLPCSRLTPFACSFPDHCASHLCGSNSTRCVSTPAGPQCECIAGHGGPNCNRVCNETLDSDGDGVDDCADTCPFHAGKWEDADSDGDGVPDCLDECPLHANLVTDVDSNGDGTLDCNECIPSETQPFSCFFKQRGRATYADAVATCREQGLHLAAPRDSLEDAQIWDILTPSLADHENLWIGVDRGFDGTWRDTRGTAASGSRWAGWASGQPSSSRQCASLNMASLTPSWFTATCERRLKFACEWRADGCMKGYVNAGGYCVRRFDEAATWQTAESTCNALSMRLASAHSRAAHCALSHIANGKDVWLGGSDAAGGWAWTDGSPWDYSWWSSGQPDNHAGRQDCLSMWVTTGSKFDDMFCKTTRPFLCHFPERCSTWSEECLNGGWCASRPTGAACECPFGVTGDRCEDFCGFDPDKTEPGACGCGVPDSDTDGDGVLDCFDGCPLDVNRTTDVDTDGDGVLDCNDHCPNDADLSDSVDTDGDGVLDCNDQCPTDPTRASSGDRDNDGVVDCVDDCPDDPLLTESPDPDGDGFPNCIDNCPLSAVKVEPGLCGCDFADTPENLADSDGDFVVNCADGCPVHADKADPGICGCGVPDVDSDGDGTVDCVDECPADPTTVLAGVCGCGVFDGDSDGDGTPDCFDACAADPLKVSPGQCGCGIPEGTCGATHSAVVVGAVASVLGVPPVVAGAASQSVGGGGEDAFLAVVRTGSGEVARVLTLGGAGDDAWLAFSSNAGVTSADKTSVVLGGRTTSRPSGLGLGAPSAAVQEGMVVLYDSLDGLLTGSAMRWAAALGHPIDSVSATVLSVIVAATPGALPIVVAVGTYQGGRLDVGGFELPHGGTGSVFAAALSSLDGTVQWATVLHDAGATGQTATIHGDSAAVTVPGGVVACFSVSDGSASIVAPSLTNGELLWRTSFSPGSCSAVAEGPMGEIIATGQVSGSVHVSGDLVHSLPASWGAQGFMLRLDSATGARVSSETFGGDDPATSTSPHSMATDPTDAGSHAIVVGEAVGAVDFSVPPSHTSPVPPSGDMTTTDAFVARFSTTSFGSADGLPQAMYRNGDMGEEMVVASTLVDDTLMLAGSVLSSGVAEGRVGRNVVAPHVSPVATLHWVALEDGGSFGESAVSSWGITGASSWNAVSAVADNVAVVAGHFLTSESYVAVPGRFFMSSLSMPALT